MKRVVLTMVPGIAGLVLLTIGASVLFWPETFAAANGVELTSNPSQRSEYRAPGGLLLASGIIVLLGAVRARQRRLAVGVAALVYGSYGLSRLVGFAADGLPSSALVQATAVELVLGAACVAMLAFLKADQGSAAQR